MNSTDRVLIVRGAVDGRGPDALETAFDVVVAEGCLDALKHLSTASVTPDCVVAPATPGDVALASFLSAVARTAPDVRTVVAGAYPAGGDDASAVFDADAYVPAGRDAVLSDRIRRLIDDDRVERALAAHRRLERTVESVAVDVAAAEDPATVESSVHDRLLESGAYRHVWVADRTASGELQVRVPATGQLGSEDLGDLVGGGDRTFVSRAVETGQVALSEGTVPTRSATSASNTESSAGPRAPPSLASAAIPFVHDGRVRGVAVVATDRGDAFDGSERELLADLGAVVGHARWALESAAEATRTETGRGMENLVHDLRNPLGIARAHLEIAREDDAPESLSRVESALDRMEETIDRVAEGLAGGGGVEVAPIDLEATAEAAWRTIEDDRASLTVVDSASMRADRDLLIRLLANLFGNAVDHGGDDVGVRVGTIPEGFFVEDDGPGIPPAARTDVFERGYSTSDDGLGIGLSIVHDVATAHGWSVAVTDADSGGARFEVTGVERAAESV